MFVNFSTVPFKCPSILWKMCYNSSRHFISLIRLFPSFTDWSKLSRNTFNDMIWILLDIRCGCHDGQFDRDCRPDPSSDNFSTDRCSSLVSLHELGLHNWGRCLLLCRSNSYIMHHHFGCFVNSSQQSLLRPVIMIFSNCCFCYSVKSELTWIYHIFFLIFPWLGQECHRHRWGFLRFSDCPCWLRGWTSVIFACLFSLRLLAMAWTCIVWVLLPIVLASSWYSFSLLLFGAFRSSSLRLAYLSSFSDSNTQISYGGSMQDEQNIWVCLA